MHKVALISSVPPPMGGIAKWTQRMLDAELEDGWGISLVDDKIRGSRECFGDDVNYNYWDELCRWLRVWKSLFVTLGDKDIKIIHCCPIATSNSMLVNIVSMLIAKIKRKKTIVHFRCTVPNLVKSRIQFFLMKLLCSLSDMIICLNTQTVVYLKKWTNSNLVLIPNFISRSEICGGVRQYEGDCKTIIYVGGVTKEKGCDLIVQLARIFPAIQFRLIGRYSSEIHTMATNLSNVVFCGVKRGEALSAEYQNADSFIFLSHFWGEGFSNSLVEAMAAGLPCIVSDWAANADQIDDGKGGFVVPVNDIEKAKDSIVKLNNPSVRAQFSSYNIAKVKDVYSSKQILRQYVNCYNQLETLFQK